MVDSRVLGTNRVSTYVVRVRNYSTLTPGTIGTIGTIMALMLV